MAEQRKNDMFLNVMSNPTYTTLDFMDAGLSAENTWLLPYDKYKENEQVRSNPIFADDNGNFDEKIFKMAYDKAQMVYYDMATSSFNEQIAKEVEFQPGSLFAMNYDNPKYANWDEETVIAEFGKDSKFGRLEYNPDRRMKNVQSVGSDYEGKYTPLELAEMNKTWNEDTGQWEAAPEEWFGKGWLENIFDPEVMAVYEKDDPEVIQGIAQEGQYKVNPETGTYYAERLNGRPTYNKEVISFWDTLTKEDSWINRYDFFDSDDKEKSFAGSAFKAVATVLPMFVPGVGPIYTGLSVGWQLGKIATGVGKIIGGTDIGWLNNADGFLSQFNSSVSQHSKENTWTMENFMEMFSMVFTQLAQQRWIFEQVPKVFGFKYGLDPKKMELLNKEYQDRFYADFMRKYTPKDIEDANKFFPKWLDINQQALLESSRLTETAMRTYQKGASDIASVISKLYMTGITTMDSYNEAKAQGATDMQAALLAFGYSLGEYGILSSPIGEWIMPELRANRQFLKEAVKREMGITKEMERAGQLATREGRSKWAARMVKLGKDLFDGAYHGGRTVKAIAANALGEGIEEMSEELLLDVNKQLWNTYNWMTGNELRYDAWKDMGDRYAMSFLGGLFGGALFGLKDIRSTMYDIDKMTPESAHQHIIYMLREGKRGDIEKVLNRYTFAPKSLAATVDVGKDGDVSLRPGTDLDNQDKLVKGEFRKVLDYYQMVLKSEGLNRSDNEIIDNALPYIRYNYLRNSTSAAIHMQGFQNALSEVVKAHQNKDRLRKEQDKGKTDSQQQKQQNDEDFNKKMAAAEKRIDDARANAQSYINGDKFKQMILEGTFESSARLNNAFKNLSLGSYVAYKTGKHVSEIPDNELAVLMDEYSKLQESGAKSNLHDSFNYFMATLQALNPILTQANEDAYRNAEENKALKDIRKQFDTYQQIIEKSIKEGGLDTAWMKLVASPTALHRVFGLGKLPGIEGSDVYSSRYAEGEEGTSPDDMSSHRKFMEKRWRESMARFDPENAQEYAEMSLDQLYQRRYDKERWKNIDDIRRRNIEDVESLGLFMKNYIDNTINTLSKISSNTYVDPVTKQMALRLVNTIESLMTNSMFEMDAMERLGIEYGSIGNLDADVDNLGKALSNIKANDNSAKVDEALKLVNSFKLSLNDIEGRYQDMIDGAKSDLDEELARAKWADSTLSGYVSENMGSNPEVIGVNTLNKLHNDLKEELSEIAGKNDNVKEYLDNMENGISSMFGLLQKASKYTTYYDQAAIKKLKGVRDNIINANSTPLIDVLDRFAIDNKGTKASKALKDIEEAFKTASTDANGFTLPSNLQEAASNLKDAIEHVRGAIHASRKMGASTTNPLGFAMMYNQLMKDSEGFTELNTIDERFAWMMDEEGIRIGQRLDMILRLSNANSANKLNENKDIEINKFLVTKKGTDLFINGMEKAGVDVSKLREDLKAVGYDEMFRRFDDLAGKKMPFNASDEELKAALKYSNDIEKVFHDFVANMGDKFSDEVIRRVIDEYDPFIPIVSDFNKGTRSFDPNTSLWYIASLIAADPEAINDAMIGAYKLNPDIAPIAPQMMGIKGMLSYMIGRPVYERFSALFKQSVRNKVDNILQGGDDGIRGLRESLESLGIMDGGAIEGYIKARADGQDQAAKSYADKIKFFVSNSNSFNIFDGIYMIGGMPGTGKTRVIARTAASILAQQDAKTKEPIVKGGIEMFEPGNFWVVSTKKAVTQLADEIQSTVNREIGDDQRKTHEGLLKELFGVESVEELHGVDDRNISVDISESGDYIAHSTASTVDLSGKKLPKLIFIDEISLFDQIAIDAISRVAKDNGIMVVAFGDELQIQPNVPVHKVRTGQFDENNPDANVFASGNMMFHMSEAQFPRAPKNGVSIRPNNSQQDVALVTLKEAVTNVRLYGSTEQFDLHYAETDAGLFGPKMEKVEYSDPLSVSAKSTIDKMFEQLKNGEANDIGVVASSSTKLYEYAQEKLKELNDEQKKKVYFFSRPVDTQGLECDYYLYMTNLSWNEDGGPENSMQSLYTVVSRSKKGSLTLHTTNYGGDTKMITNVRDDSSMRTGFNKEAVRAYSEKYLSFMDDILKDKKLAKLSLSTPGKVTVKQMGNLAPISLPGRKESFGKNEMKPDDNDSTSEEGVEKAAKDAKKEVEEKGIDTEKETGTEDDNDLDMSESGGATKASNLQRGGTVVSGIAGSTGFDERMAEDNDNVDPWDLSATEALGYTHSVDEMGVGVVIDRNNLEIKLNENDDSTGLNGVVKLLALFERKVRETRPTSTAPSINSLFASGPKSNDFLKIKFNNENELDKFVNDSRAFLHDLRMVMISGNNQDEITNNAGETIKSFIRTVYGFTPKDDGRTMDFIGYMDMKFAFRKAGDPDDDVKANRQGKVFPSMMNTNEYVPSLRMDVQFTIRANDDDKIKHDRTVIGLSLFTMENIKSKMRQRSFEDGIMQWCRDVRAGVGNPSNDMKDMASMLMDIYEKGEIGYNRNISTLKVAFDLMKNFSNFGTSNSQVLKSQLEHIAYMFYIYKNNSGMYMPIEKQDAFKMLSDAKYSPAVLRTKGKGGSDMYSGTEYEFNPTEVNMADIAAMPFFAVSPIYISNKDITNSDGSFTVASGRAFVLVSEDPTYRGKEGTMLDEYIRLSNAGKDTSMFRIYSVTPPKFEVRDFADKIFNILSKSDIDDKKRQAMKLIGNVSTIYGIFRTMATNSDGNISRNELIKNLDVFGITPNGNEHKSSTMVSGKSGKDSYVRIMRNALEMDGKMEKLNNHRYYKTIDVLMYMLDTLDEASRFASKSVFNEMLFQYNIMFNRIFSYMMFDRNAHGKITISNPDAYKENISRLETVLNEKGINGIFASTNADEWVENGDWKYAKVKDSDGFLYDVEGRQYPFTVFGKMDTGVAIFDYMDMVKKVVDKYDKNATKSFGDGISGQKDRNMAISNWINKALFGNPVRSSSTSNTGNQAPVTQSPVVTQPPATPVVRVFNEVIGFDGENMLKPEMHNENNKGIIEAYEKMLGSDRKVFGFIDGTNNLFIEMVERMSDGNIHVSTFVVSNKNEDGSNKFDADHVKEFKEKIKEIIELNNNESVAIDGYGDGILKVTKTIKDGFLSLKFAVEKKPEIKTGAVRANIEEGIIWYSESKIDSMQKSTKDFVNPYKNSGMEKNFFKFINDVIEFINGLELDGNIPEGIRKFINGTRSEAMKRKVLEKINDGPIKDFIADLYNYKNPITCQITPF